MKFGASFYLILANQYLDQYFILDVVQGHEDEPRPTVYTFGSSLKTRPLLVRGLFFLVSFWVEKNHSPSSTIKGASRSGLYSHTKKPLNPFP